MSLARPSLKTPSQLADRDADQSSGQAGTQTFSGVNSIDLLQGQKAVAIQHNGSTYRLQATRLGKLILTK